LRWTGISSMQHLVTAALLTTILAGCTQVFFQPGKLEVITPDQLGLAHEEVRFRTDDGLELFGWFLPAHGKALGTVLFLHGNAENISTHIINIAWMPERRFNVFLFDYRGYGASQGHPTLSGLQLDIDAALRTLLARADVDTKRIIVFGQSLGGSIAVYYVAHSMLRDRISSLVIDSAFSGYASIAREKLASIWLTWPVQWLAALTIDDRFNPLQAVRLVSPIPLLVIQGDRDAIVPLHHAQLLYDAALEPKQLWVVAGAAHIQALHDEIQRDRLVDYLSSVVTRN
jgi:uncharacterized protein